MIEPALRYFANQEPMTLIRNLSHFPSKKHSNFLAYNSVSPVSLPAADRAIRFINRQSEVGRGMLAEYVGEESVATRFHKNFGALLKTSPDNISMSTNTSESLSMIANGYPLTAGDQIISYVHEYPANHYPWVIQSRRRGVELIQLSDVEMDQEQRDYVASVPGSFARSWSFDELESRVTPRTKIIALSHVQFTSGFAADLPRLGAFCRQRQIDLVIDAAQALGCLPIYPEEYGIACVASSGWKWLLGHIGAGVMYTSPEFREKIQITMSGSDHMKQESDYLNHTWDPYATGKKFEFSTVSYALLDGLSVGVEEIFLPNTLEAIRDHNFAMQELILAHLDFSKYQPVVHLPAHRSGILALIPKISTAEQIAADLNRQKIVITPRDGYLRLAPHLCTTEDEVLAAVAALNRLS